VANFFGPPCTAIRPVVVS